MTVIAGAAGVQEVIYFLLALSTVLSRRVSTSKSWMSRLHRFIVTETTERELTNVMSNSFGFGGTNANVAGDA